MTTRFKELYKQVLTTDAPENSKQELLLLASQIDPTGDFGDITSGIINKEALTDLFIKLTKKEHHIRTITHGKKH